MGVIPKAAAYFKTATNTFKCKCTNVVNRWVKSFLDRVPSELQLR